MVIEIPVEEGCSGWVFLARSIENMFFRDVMKEKGLHMVPPVERRRGPETKTQV